MQLSVREHGKTAKLSANRMMCIWR